MNINNNNNNYDLVVFLLIQSFKKNFPDSSCPPTTVEHGRPVKVDQSSSSDLEVTYECDVAYEFPHGDTRDTFVCKNSIWTKPPVDCQSKPQEI